MYFNPWQPLLPFFLFVESVEQDQTVYTCSLILLCTFQCPVINFCQHSLPPSNAVYPDEMLSCNRHLLYARKTNIFGGIVESVCLSVRVSVCVTLILSREHLVRFCCYFIESFLIHRSMAECNTILSAYTKYRHLG